MPWLKTSELPNQALQDKRSAIKELIVCNSWDVSAFGRAYQTYFEVLSIN